jgi:ABC-type branched-subunit amino acid transport system substrate-binding protein
MKHIRLPLIVALIAVLFFSFATAGFAKKEVVKIALNYPQTGPYAKQGKDQWYAAEIARKEINEAGGILGKKVVYRWYDSASNPNKTRANLSRAIDHEKVQMVFGGSSSAVAIAAGEMCKKKERAVFRHVDLLHRHNRQGRAHPHLSRVL